MASASPRTALTPSAAQALRVRRLTSAVVSAWTNPHGTVPGRHSLRVQRLRSTWPQLADALDMLTAAARDNPGTTDPYRCPRCSLDVEAVHADVDARTATHVYRLSPCGCYVDRGTALDAYEQGVTPVVTPINGATLANAERARQRVEEGYSIDHDLATNGAGELAWAAFCILDAAASDAVAGDDSEPPPMWPWPRSSWRPGKTPMRHIVHAAALLIAELDRRLALGETPDDREATP